LVLTGIIRSTVYKKGGSIMDEKYSVYKCSAKSAYSGISLIAADSVEEANQIISMFKENDKDNSFNSFGYSNIDEYDLMDNLYSTEKGILYFGIYYTGWC